MNMALQKSRMVELCCEIIQYRTTYILFRGLLFARPALCSSESETEFEFQSKANASHILHPRHNIWTWSLPLTELLCVGHRMCLFLEMFSLNYSFVLRT